MRAGVCIRVCVCRANACEATSGVEDFCMSRGLGCMIPAGSAAYLPLQSHFPGSPEMLVIRYSRVWKKYFAVNMESTKCCARHSSLRRHKLGYYEHYLRCSSFAWWMDAQCWRERGSCCAFGQPPALGMCTAVSCLRNRMLDNDF